MMRSPDTRLIDEHSVYREKSQCAYTPGLAQRSAAGACLPCAQTSAGLQLGSSDSAYSCFAATIFCALQLCNMHVSTLRTRKNAFMRATGPLCYSRIEHNRLHLSLYRVQRNYGCSAPTVQKRRNKNVQDIKHLLV